MPLGILSVYLYESGSAVPDCLPCTSLCLTKADGILSLNSETTQTAFLDAFWKSNIILVICKPHSHASHTHRSYTDEQYETNAKFAVIAVS